jgi:hypothetical protein
MRMMLVRVHESQGFNAPSVPQSTALMLAVSAVVVGRRRSRARIRSRRSVMTDNYCPTACDIELVMQRLAQVILYGEAKTPPK